MQSVMAVSQAQRAFEARFQPGRSQAVRVIERFVHGGQPDSLQVGHRAPEFPLHVLHCQECDSTWHKPHRRRSDAGLQPLVVIEEDRIPAARDQYDAVAGSGVGHNGPHHRLELIPQITIPIVVCQAPAEGSEHKETGGKPTQPLPTPEGRQAPGQQQIEEGSEGQEVPSLQSGHIEEGARQKQEIYENHGQGQGNGNEPDALKAKGVPRS